ncbi:hypothetical protein Tco_1502936 [Tanacetum coccineum]
MVSYLRKPEGTTARTTNEGEVEITASIDRQVKTITEASLRRHLKLEDSDGITSLPNIEIFEQLAHIGNMKRASRGYSWVDFPLFPTMITTPESSPSRITSSPSLSPQTYQSPQSSPLKDITRRDAKIPQSQFLTQTQVADEATFTSVDVDAAGAATTDIVLEEGQGSVTMHKTPTRPHDSPFQRVHTLRSDEGSLQQNELMDLVIKMTDRVEVLENDLQQKKMVYSSALTKLIMRVKKLEHTVKTRKPRRRAKVIISDTEEDLEDPSKQGRRIAEIDQNPYISLVQDEGTSWIQEDAKIQGKTSADTEILLDQEEPTELVEDLGSGEKGEKEISIANISVSTASATPEVSIAAANSVYIRRSAEKRKDKGKAIMKEDESLQEEFDRARQEQEVIAEADQAHDIDWSDPSVLRYHTLQNRSFSVAEVRKNMYMYLKNQGGYKQSHFKGMSYEDIRPIFERVWDQNNAFVPKDSEIEKEVMKRPGFDFQQKSSKKRSREDSDEDNAKKQKLEDDAEKEELRDSMDVVPRDDIAIDVESLATKYPIVDWKTHVLTENMMYYQIIRADGSSKNYKIFSEMLDDFDRQDVLDLHRLVQERYDTTSPEGYDLLLWGDLKILFEPNEEDEIWKNQQDYNLISWRLFDSCGIHMLLMHTGIAIHMMIEKKYPLTQEMLSRMLSRRLEVDQESEMAFELLRTCKLSDIDVHTLEDPTLILEIMSRRFFLRLNLPDHSIKVKETSKTTNNQAFTIKKGMSMPVQMTQAQDGERPQVDDQRLDLADDLKDAQDHISHSITSHKTKITTSKYKILREKSKTTSKTQDQSEDC